MVSLFSAALCRGIVDGIEYHLIACDWLRFRPKLIVE